MSTDGKLVRITHSVIVNRKCHEINIIVIHIRYYHVVIKLIKEFTRSWIEKPHPGTIVPINTMIWDIGERFGRRHWLLGDCDLRDYIIDVREWIHNHYPNAIVSKYNYPPCLNLEGNEQVAARFAGQPQITDIPFNEWIIFFPISLYSMPEGPEVKILTRGLAKILAGNRIVNIKVLSGRYKKSPPEGLSWAKKFLHWSDVEISRVIKSQSRAAQS